MGIVESSYSGWYMRDILGKAGFDESRHPEIKVSYFSKLQIYCFSVFFRETKGRTRKKNWKSKFALSKSENRTEDILG